MNSPSTRDYTAAQNIQKVLQITSMQKQEQTTRARHVGATNLNIDHTIGQPICTGISLRGLASPGSTPARWLKYFGPILDRVLGLHTFDRLYRRHHLQDLPPFEFVTRTLHILNVTTASPQTPLTDRIPESGPLLVVCNHPYGGMEALILAETLRSVRTDVKFLANSALTVFRELQPLLIATNPLKVSQKNLTSIRECEAQLKRGGVLVLFPAGRVSCYQHAKQRITDGNWNRMVGHLAITTEATLLPVFFHGTNSRLFHFVGRLWDRSKLLMLPREFLKLRGRRISFSVGRPLPAPLWRHMNTPELTAFTRVMTYMLQLIAIKIPKTNACIQHSTTLAPYGNKDCISHELNALPPQQRLLDFKHFSVFYATADQIPTLMGDIGRERERVFRLHDEGSGKQRDTDKYDSTYTQLFVWDNDTQSLVGAYRLGKVEQLRIQYGPSGNYLSQMFEFDPAFYDPSAASLELGRSFIVPEHQKTFHALYLLWQGIGRFLVAHPQYRHLYGTVSLSRQYDDRAVALLCHALIKPSTHVRPRHALRTSRHAEWQEYLSIYGTLDLQTLSALVRGLDADGKDIPILLKHYYKLGAKFHCVGIDPNFNATPGLLLSIDIPQLTPKSLSTFLGEGAKAYLAYPSTHQGQEANRRVQTIRAIR